jgi:hypothetical protein
MASHLALCLLAFLVTPSHAFWRMPCAQPVVVERSDPIINPGAVSGHTHTIMGGNGFGFAMTYADTQASTCTSCIVTKDLSNYWVPQLYYKGQDGTFTSVNQQGGVLVYYIQRADPLDPEYSKGLLAFPPGFRMVAGNPFLRSFNSSSLEAAAITYNCLGTNNPQTNGFPNYNCPGGLRTQVFFPSCWDGVNLDSADHKSHMAYPSQTDSGHCPPTHPKRFISLFYEIVWNTPDFANKWYGNKQPFVWAMGDDTGYGYHGDFVNGWDVPTLQKAVDTCTDDSGVIQLCPVFKLQTDAAQQACRVPPAVHEQVLGTLPALPGCNPVQSGPANAVPKSGCGATTTIGAPMWPYTDVTKSKGFKYIGCGSDPAGASRTLTGASKTDASGMTVESCIDFCSSNGYSIAGLEYTTQCFCGNSVAADRAPVSGFVGACAMPCSGNSGQVCGGPAMLSLYQKCSSGSCTNIKYAYNSGSGVSMSKLKRQERRRPRTLDDSESTNASLLV